jgi:hypothetical protein
MKLMPGRRHLKEKHWLNLLGKLACQHHQHKVQQSCFVFINATTVVQKLVNQIEKQNRIL